MAAWVVEKKSLGKIKITIWKNRLWINVNYCIRTDHDKNTDKNKYSIIISMLMHKKTNWIKNDLFSTTRIDDNNYFIDWLGRSISWMLRLMNLYPIAGI